MAMMVVMMYKKGKKEENRAGHRKKTDELKLKIGC